MQVTTNGIGWTTTDYAYNARNEIAGWTRDADTCTYTYDANGNRITKSVDGVYTDYFYDTSNRLISADVDGVTAFEAAYDYRTRRVSAVRGHVADSWTAESEHPKGRALRGVPVRPRVVSRSSPGSGDTLPIPKRRNRNMSPSPLPVRTGKPPRSIDITVAGSWAGAHANLILFPAIFVRAASGPEFACGPGRVCAGST